jgi:hypothetical protein
MLPARVPGRFKLAGRLRQFKQCHLASGISLHCPDDQTAQDRLGLGYFLGHGPFTERDLLLQDLLKQRAQVLAAFGPAGWIAGCAGFEPTVQRGPLEADRIACGGPIKALTCKLIVVIVHDQFRYGAVTRFPC